MSPVRWLRVAAVVGATALLLASSCTWHLGAPLPNGVPPPPGDPVPPVDTYQANGRPADQLHDWAAKRARALRIPVTALEAYGYAARVAEVENPDCHLSWNTLAGIGQIESHHGTYGRAILSRNGNVQPPIRGVRLDGSDGTLRIVESDQTDLADRADQDDRTDQADQADRADSDGVVRAMGPMQFIPETWRLYGVDANNDGVVSPDNIDDAALSAAGYLCWRGKDLDTARGWVTALLAYNDSEIYLRAVRDWATAYAAGHPL